MKTTLKELRQIISESIKKYLLSESGIEPAGIYWPGETTNIPDEMFHNIPDGLIKDTYNIYLNPDDFSDTPVFDSGFQSDLEKVRSINPELAQALENDFSKWRAMQDEYSVDYKPSDEPVNYDD